MTKIIHINACAQCPHLSWDSTNILWEGSELDQYFWQQAQEGNTCACLKLQQAMSEDEAEGGILSNCPLPDKSET